MDLEAREIEVLNIIVQAYIDYAQPVGSRHVAKKSTLKLSPASMRNIMADLTEKGYLTQPHTSAGRIPTQKAFRLFVNSMLEPIALSNDSREAIKNVLAQTGLDFSELLETTSKLISSQVNQVGMALAPQTKLARWQQLDFSLVRPGLAVAILVFQGGIVQNKLITLDEKITADDLKKYSNYLNDTFKGQTFLEVRLNLIKEMQEARDQFNALYIKALSLIQSAFSEKDNREIFVDGTLYVFNQIDQHDLSSMRELLEFLEQRSDLLELLDKVSESSGLLISFGNEFYGPKLENWTLISTPYQVKGETMGIIGTLGPINMNYSKVVPLVDYIAKMLTDVLDSRF